MKLKTDDESIRSGLEKIELLAMEGAETVRCIQEFTSHTRYKEPEAVDLRELVHSCVNSQDAIWRKPADHKEVSVISDIKVDEAFIEG